METRANYALIGFFTLFVIAAGFFFVLWVAGRDTRNLVPYRIVFTGSVSGLSRGSVVLYNGLKVGDVKSIALMPSDPGKVVAWINVDGSTPINVDTKARLEFQGLTGVASIQMTGGNPDSKVLIVDDPANPPIIFAERSDFQDLLENAQRLSRRADDVLQHAERIFAESETPVTETMKNIQLFSKALADNSGSITTLLSSTAKASQAISDVSGKANDFVDKLNAAAVRLDRVLAGAETWVNSDEIKGSIVDIGAAAKSVRSLAEHLDRSSSGSLRDFEALTVDSRKTLNELNRALRDFEQNPQKLIFGAKPGVPVYNGPP